MDLGLVGSIAGNRRRKVAEAGFPGPAPSVSARANLVRPSPRVCRCAFAMGLQLLDFMQLTRASEAIQWI